MNSTNTEYTQKNGAFYMYIYIYTAPFFCVYPVYKDKGRIVAVHSTAAYESGVTDPVIHNVDTKSK
jgi:hypothetical protein